MLYNILDREKDDWQGIVLNLEVVGVKKAVKKKGILLLTKHFEIYFPAEWQWTWMLAWCVQMSFSNVLSCLSMLSNPVCLFLSLPSIIALISNTFCLNFSDHVLFIPKVIRYNIWDFLIKKCKSHQYFQHKNCCSDLLICILLLS